MGDCFSCCGSSDRIEPSSPDAKVCMHLILYHKRVQVVLLAGEMVISEVYPYTNSQTTLYIKILIFRFSDLLQKVLSIQLNNINIIIVSISPFQ